MHGRANTARRFVYFGRTRENSLGPEMSYDFSRNSWEKANLKKRRRAISRIDAMAERIQIKYPLHFGRESIREPVTGDSGVNSKFNVCIS